MTSVPSKKEAPPAGPQAGSALTIARRFSGTCGTRDMLKRLNRAHAGS